MLFRSLVDSREPEYLAQAMEKMLINRCYTSKLAANTRPHILDRLDDRMIAAQTQALYEQLFDECRPVEAKKQGQIDEQ